MIRAVTMVLFARIVTVILGIKIKTMENKFDSFVAQWLFSSVLVLYFVFFIIEGQNTISITELTLTLIVTLLTTQVYRGINKSIKK